MRGDFVSAQTAGVAAARGGAIVDLHIQKELGKSGESLSDPARRSDSHRMVSIYYDNKKSREIRFHRATTPTASTHGL